MVDEQDKPSDAILAKLDQYVAAIDDQLPLQLDDLFTDNAEQNDSIQRLIATINDIDALPASTTYGTTQYPPLELDGWKLVRFLGRGGSGIVFEGQREDERAAVKVIFRNDNGQNRARWKREVEIIRRLQHPHIIPLVDAGESGGVSYVAMKLVPGITLGELIESRRQQQAADTDPSSVFENESARLSPPFSSPTHDRQYVQSALELIADVAEALDAAHQAGVIHRDVKPSNVLVQPDGHAWLTDFGMATTPADQTLTASGMTVGTLGYMSPEQAAGAAGNPRSDIYSLGVAALELLTLTPPLASLPWRNERARLWGPSWSRYLPSRAKKLLVRMIEVDPDQRPDSAGAVAEQLRSSAQQSSSPMPSRWLVWLGVLPALAAVIWWLSGISKRFETPTERQDTTAVVDQQAADSMRQQRVELLKKTAPQHSWDRPVERNDTRLVIEVAALDTQGQPIESVAVGDRVWIALGGNATVHRDDRWHRSVTFSIRGIMKAEPPGRFEFVGEPVWATGYRNLDDQFKVFPPVCMAGPIAGIAVDKSLYRHELGEVPPQPPVVRLECQALSPGKVDVQFELPVTSPGNTNTVRHVPRQLFDEEVSSSPLTLEIIAE